MPHADPGQQLEQRRAEHRDRENARRRAIRALVAEVGLRSDMAGQADHCRTCGKGTLFCSTACETAMRSAELALRDHRQLLVSSVDESAIRRSAWRMRCLMAVVDVLAGITDPVAAAKSIAADEADGLIEADPSFFVDMTGPLDLWIRRRATK